jgi:hypothetical protein
VSEKDKEKAKNRSFPDEGPTVQMSWVDVLLGYCDRAHDCNWENMDTLDEMHHAFSAGLKAGRAE